MATIDAVSLHVAKRGIAANENRAGLRLTAVLTVLALFIHGYHPYSEDGGVYLPGIEKILHPELFPSWSEFVTAHERWSLFAPSLALLVRLTHVDLMVCVLAIHVLAIWATLFAAWKLSVLCELGQEACAGAATVLALTLTIPVAGTSLILIDPYLTARSISTPCSLFALVGALGVRRSLREAGRVDLRSVSLLVGALLAAMIVHPLMGGYAIGCVFFLACSWFEGSKRRMISTVCVWCFSVCFSGLLYAMTPSQPVAYWWVAHTRTYWFLSEWHWYEWVGLVGPLAVLTLLWGRGRLGANETTKLLAQASLAAGSCGVAVALLFARDQSANDFVASLQPLRIYLAIYLLMLIAIGAALGQMVLQRHTWRWVLLVLSLGGGMASVQRATYRASAHLELPWSQPANQWEKGFLWVRNNTPQNALIALDANYITASDEDGQNFRAIAERSALPDYSKDGGTAAIAPDLADQWREGQRLQFHLNEEIGAGQTTMLDAEDVNWVVVSKGAATNLRCPYVNEGVKVCRVGDVGDPTRNEERIR